MPNLWTPDRDIPLDRGLGVDHATPREMQILADLHTVAQKFGLVLVCKKCDHSFQGQNDGNGRSHAIWCKCREIKADFQRRIV